MSIAQLNLVVIRAIDLERAVAFYEQLGLVFTRHRHGNGPEHLSCERNGLVFEIYPRQNQADDTSATRLGFAVPALDSTISLLQAHGATINTPPKPSPWGQRAVVTDPDGHRIELTQSEWLGM